MRPIKITAWIVTGIFTLWFFIRIAALANIQTRYGSPATSPPVILGLFLGCALIPGILWLIVILTKKNTLKKVTNQKLNTSNLPIEKGKYKPENIKSIKVKLKDLKESGLLTTSEYNDKRNDIEANEKKNKLIIELQEAYAMGIFTKEEYNTKLKAINPKKAKVLEVSSDTNKNENASGVKTANLSDVYSRIKESKLTENLHALNELITKQQKSFILGSHNDAIKQLTNELCSSKFNAEQILSEYLEIFNQDLIEDLKSLSSSYDGMKSYLAPFIRFEIIDKNHPHNILKNN